MTAAVLAVALASTAPASPFSGCEASPISDRGWHYDCGDWGAFVEDWEQLLPEGSLDAMQRAVPVLLGSNDVVRSRERRPIQGREAVVRRTQARNDFGAVLLTAVPRPAGTRVLCCSAPGTADKCYAVLDHLAAAPWRARPPSDALLRGTALTLGGKPVVVPSGCKGEVAYGGARVSCPPAFFASWVPIAEPAQVPLMMEHQGKELMAILGAPPTEAKRDRVRCAMAGVETTCERASMTGERGATALWAAVRVGGGLVFGHCLAPAGASLQPPCSVLFSLSDAR